MPVGFNLESTHAQTLLATRWRFAILRVSWNIPGWNEGLLQFLWSIILQKQFITKINLYSMNYTFFYKQHFYKQRRAETGK